MTNAVTSPPAAELVSPPSCGRLVREALRRTNANLIAPLLLFLAVAPLMAGSSAGDLLELNDASSSAAAETAEFLISWLMEAWRWAVLPVLFATAFLLLPGVAGGAAGRFAETADDFDRRPRPFTEHARRFWGRTVALGFVYVLLMIALGVVAVRLSSIVEPPEAGETPPNYDDQIDALASRAHDPVRLATRFGSDFLGAGLMTISTLCLAAMAVEDRGPLRSINRGVGSPGTELEFAL